MENLKNIAFDADDVLIKTIEMLNKFHNIKYGKKLILEEYKVYDFSKVWNISYEQTVEDVRSFYESELYEHVQIADGAHEAVDYLCKKYNLAIVTSRNKDMEIHLTATLTRLFYPGHFSDVHFVGWGTDSSMQKWEKCKESDIPILIDDNHGHLIPAVEQGMHGILIPAPWNKNITDLPKGIVRARNLNEAVEIIEKNQKMIWE